jgi:hypothetical protein
LTTKVENISHRLSVARFPEKPYHLPQPKYKCLFPSILETLLPYSGETGKSNENKVIRLGWRWVLAFVLRFVSSK